MRKLKAISAFIITFLLSAFFVGCEKSSNGLMENAVGFLKEMKETDSGKEVPEFVIVSYQKEDSTAYLTTDIKNMEQILGKITKTDIEKSETWTNAQIELPLYFLCMTEPFGSSLNPYRSYGYYSNGYWVDEEGNAYKMKLDIPKLIKNSSLPEVRKFSSINNFYGARDIFSSEKGYLVDLLTKAPDSSLLEGMKAKVTELTKTSVFAELVCSEEWAYGQRYDIEGKFSSEWYALPPAVFERVYDDILYVQPAGKMKKVEYSLLPYGDLPSGEYRVVTEVNGERSILFEFQVE